MLHGNESSLPARQRHRGPSGLGEQAAAALGEGLAAGQSLGGMAAQDRLRQWAEKAHCLIPESEWLSLKLISAATAEHEVRYRIADHRAVKRTWPGTFGFVPGRHGSNWAPVPASPQEYLLRQRLQNDLFKDDIRLEGLMISDGPSMIIGQPSGGVSLVISQPWLDAADPDRPHPTESQIAEFMGRMGFSPLLASLYGWHHAEDTLIILDAKPDNFVLTHSGILPIDLLITEIITTASA
jgi:hypothetical protein